MDMDIGSIVHTPDGLQRVAASIAYEQRETLRVCTKDGYFVEGTPNHRMMTPSGWKTLEELESGDAITLSPIKFSDKYQKIKFNSWNTRRSDTVAVPVVTDSCPNVTIDENYGLLIGAILGDGNVTRLTTRITCDVQDMDWAERLVNICVNKIGVPAKIQAVGGGGNCVNVVINSVKFNEFLAHIGVWGGAGNQTGRHSRPKNFWVPECILRSPCSVISAFLTGLFEADGTSSECSVSFCTKSERLAKEVQILLSGFGITCKRTAYINKAYSREYYYIALRRAESDVFEQEIGFSSQRKIDKLSTITGRPHSNAYRPIAWVDTVESIDRGCADVYDLEVEDEHCYLAAGFVSHNSAVKALEAMASKRMTKNGAVGAVAVCTDMPVYSQVVKNGKNGLLVDNNRWYEALKSLIANDSRRLDLAKKGHKWVKKNKDIRRGYKLWESALSQA